MLRLILKVIKKNIFVAVTIIDVNDKIAGNGRNVLFTLKIGNGLRFIFEDININDVLKFISILRDGR